MKRLCKITIGFVALCIAAGGTHSGAFAENSRPIKAKSIIFMVPDGMGLSNVTAARIFANGPDGKRLDFETLENIGYQSTHSANNTVTDSAAAASAWASGDKFLNGEISCHGDAQTGECAEKVPTILEQAARLGKSTGLVATSQISHATPAAFGAHAFSRYCGAEIARQYIVGGVDVIMGGGVYKTKDQCAVYGESFARADKRQYIIDLAVATGYTFVTDKTSMNRAAAAENKVFAMFEQNGRGKGKTVEQFHVDPTAVYPEGEPSLAEMTSTALDILEDNRLGFFLLVEGSQIDWENHGHRVAGQIAETLAFNEAVKVVLAWIDANPGRKQATLVVVVADHDTGGFAINGPNGTLARPGDIVEVGWTSDGHTAVDTIIYSQGPGSDMLNAALDNTHIYDVMKKVLH